MKPRSYSSGILFVLFLFICTGAGRTENARDERIKFTLAAGYYNKSEYGKAIQHFREFLAQFKDSGRAEDASFFLADSLLKSGDETSALSCFQSFLSEFPKSSKRMNVLRLLGDGYYYSENYEKAIPYISEYIGMKNAPGKERFTLLLGECYYLTGNLPEAGNCFSRVTKSRNPTVAGSANYYLGMILYNNNQIKKSLDYLEASLKLLPPDDNPGLSDEIHYTMKNILISIALAEEQKGNFQKAADEYSRYKQLFPSDTAIPEINYTLLNIYNNLKKKEKMKQLAEKILGSVTDTDIIWRTIYRMGNFYKENNDLVSTSNYFKKIDTFDVPPEIRKNFYYEIAEIEREQEHIKDAFNYYLKVLELEKDTALLDDIYFVAGMCQLNLNLMDTSLLYFSSVNPGNSDIQFEIAEILFEFKKYSVAINYYVNAGRDMPDTTLYLARYKLAICYENIDQPKKALNVYRTIINIREDITGRIAFNEGLLEMRNKRYHQAIKKFQFVLKEHPYETLVNKTRFYIARLYEETGKINLARSKYKWLTRHGDDVWKIEAEDRLTALKRGGD